MKKSNYFRQIKHPRTNLTLSQESIDYLNSKNQLIPAVNPTAVHMEFLNYFDHYDLGLDLGNKQIRRIGKKTKLNHLYFKWDKKPSKYHTNLFSRRFWNKYRNSKYEDINNTKLNITKVGEHITQQRKWYWTGNPFSSIRILGTDIDNHTTDPEDVLPFLQLLQHYYPNSFYDRGSSGKSLHYYPKIDMLPLYEYYSKNTSISCSWAEFANKIINYTGKIYYLYGINILCPDHTMVQKTDRSGAIHYKPDYSVHFDGFKGTYPIYDFDINQDDQIVIKKILKNGLLHKFPNIFTVDDLITFRDTPVYSIVYHLSVATYLGNILLLSGCYAEKDYKDLTEALQEIGTILEAHSVLLPQAKNFVASPPNPTETIREKREGSTLCIYNGTFENVADIALETDAYLRSRRYLYYCYTHYMITEGREPTFEEYRQNYRQDVGTGPEDEEDRRRLEYIYNRYISKMRTYFYGTLEQKIEIMEGKLGLDQEEINRTHTYHRIIWKKEVAITALWIELCLTNTNYIQMKNWWSLKKGEHFSRELTVPTVSLENFVECLKEKGLTRNGCKDNHSKAKALREIVEKIQWMQCVDDSVVVAAHNDNKNGRSRRYILLPDHPSYQKFENLVGKDRIEYWKNFRKKQLEQRKNRKLKRKIG